MFAIILTIVVCILAVAVTFSCCKVAGDSDDVILGNEEREEK